MLNIVVSNLTALKSIQESQENSMLAFRNYLEGRAFEKYTLAHEISKAEEYLEVVRDLDYSLGRS